MKKATELLTLGELLLKKNIPLYDLHAANVMVKKTAESKYIPVLINYKKAGTRTYFPQPWIFSKKGRKEKTKKEFQKLYNYFMN